MKFFKLKFFIFLFSILISISFLIIFEPILTAKSLIFPYSIHPFDIVKNYPKVWFYIKIIYCFTLFVTSFLALNSISIFFNLNEIPNTHKSIVKSSNEKDNTFSLLIGNDSNTQNKVFIPEKGLYQNILITGTIGSRKNKLCYVSTIKSIDEK